MPTCNRCGQCCHYYHKGKLEPCRHLEKVGDKTTCRIYWRRKGTVITFIGKKRIKCTPRNTSKVDYPGCPFNKGLPMFSAKNQN